VGVEGKGKRICKNRHKTTARKPVRRRYESDSKKVKGRITERDEAPKFRGEGEQNKDRDQESRKKKQKRARSFNYPDNSRVFKPKKTNKRKGSTFPGEAYQTGGRLKERKNEKGGEDQPGKKNDKGN